VIACTAKTISLVISSCSDVGASAVTNERAAAGSGRTDLASATARGERSPMANLHVVFATYRLTWIALPAIDCQRSAHVPVPERMNMTVIGFLRASMTGCTWGGPGDV
jgi:hypothetical protein